LTKVDLKAKTFAIVLLTQLTQDQQRFTICHWRRQLWGTGALALAPRLQAV